MFTVASGETCDAIISPTQAFNSDIGMIYNTVKQSRNITDMPILKDPKEWATSTKQDHHTKLGEDPSAKRTDDGRATW